MGVRHQLAVYSPITVAAEASAIAAALRLTGDPRPRLCALLREEYDADEVTLCGSGTQALQLAIGAVAAALGDRPIVALPAFSCFDVASAVIGADLRVALYDLDPETLAPNLESLEGTLRTGARIVVVSPLYGVPVDWSALETLALPYGAVIIEDAAQGHGASWQGRMLGAVGSISTLSFGRGKGWTGGSGGAVLVRGGPQPSTRPSTPRVAESSSRSEASTIAGSVAQWLLGRPAIYGIPRSVPSLGLGVTTYHAPSEPVEISRAAAAGVLANRERSRTEAVVRRRTAQRYLEQVDERAATPVRSGDGGEPGYLRFPVLASAELLRMVDGQRLRQLGVERSYPTSLGTLEALVPRLAGTGGQWPGATRLASALVTLPTHSRLSDADVHGIIALTNLATSG